MACAWSGSEVGREPGGQAVGSVGTGGDDGPWSGFMPAYAESDVGALLAPLREEGQVEVSGDRSAVYQIEHRARGVRRRRSTSSPSLAWPLWHSSTRTGFPARAKVMAAARACRTRRR